MSYPMQLIPFQMILLLLLFLLLLLLLLLPLPFHLPLLPNCKLLRNSIGLCLINEE